MLEESVMALASLAGQTVVAAAATDAWEATRRGLARLLGRGDQGRTEVAESRLTETYERLAGNKRLAGNIGADLEQVRAALEAQWVTRVADLLEEVPGVEADLRTLLQEIQAMLPAAMVSASDYAVLAGHDVNISATSGGVAAGVIHGSVAPPDPTPPDRVSS